MLIDRSSRGRCQDWSDSECCAAENCVVTIGLTTVCDFSGGSIEWDFTNRDIDGDYLLNWHQGTESGLDNSPLWDSPHSDTLHMGATEFSSYAALEMLYIAQFHTILGNSSGALYWNSRANRTIEAIHRVMWDEVDKFYYYHSANGFVRVQTPCGFTPLLLPGVSDDRVSALIKYVANLAVNMRSLYVH